LSPAGEKSRKSEAILQEIASLLGISPRTVESHRTQIKTKLGISLATDLTLVARAYLLWEATGLDHLIKAGLILAGKNAYSPP
jgi:hypothetical protein